MKITKKEYIEMNWEYFIHNNGSRYDDSGRCKKAVDIFLKLHNIQVEDENEPAEKVKTGGFQSGDFAGTE